MQGRYLIIVTIVAVIFTAGVVAFAFGEVSGNDNLSKFQATAVQYWRKVKNFASPEDSDVSRYLEEASQAVDSAMKSITR